MAETSTGFARGGLGDPTDARKAFCGLCDGRPADSWWMMAIRAGTRRVWGSHPVRGGTPSRAVPAERLRRSATPRRGAGSTSWRS